MKIGLLNANNPPAKKRGKLVNFINKMYPSLGLLYLESYGKKHFSKELDFIITDSLEELNLESSDIPDIIGISSGTKNFSHTIEMARKIKEINRDIPLILGGPHISVLPYSLPEYFELGVIGEGEVTFTELLKLFSKKGVFLKKDLENLPGIVFPHKGCKLKVNSPGPLIKKLDEIPFPERRLKRGAIAHLITSRGCKFNCYFCSTPQIWKKYRAHSSDYVLEELKNIAVHIKEGHIIFFDDLFICDKKRLKEIGDRISSEGLNNNFTFFAYGRTELFDEETAKILKKMNVTEVTLGTQTGLSKLASVRFKEGEFYHQRAADICNNYGIKLTCSFIIGKPFETEEDLKGIYNFIDRNITKIDSFQISPLRAFPGSPLWDYAKEMGLVSDFMKDWSLVEDFTLFSDFDMDNYIYLNKTMPLSLFEKYCRKLRELLGCRKKS